MFITSSKNNPYPALEDIYSKCIVIKVKNLKIILKKMNIDKISLIENIQSDLFNFSHLLASFDFFNIKEDRYRDWERRVIVFTRIRRRICCKLDSMLLS